MIILKREEVERLAKAVATRLRSGENFHTAFRTEFRTSSFCLDEEERVRRDVAIILAEYKSKKEISQSSHLPSKPGKSAGVLQGLLFGWQQEHYPD